MTQARTVQPFRIHGRHVLIAVIAFFGVVIVVDTLFVMAAYRTYPGQVSATPYEDGLAYNRTVRERQAQAALGWRAVAQVAAPGVHVRIVDRGDQPVTGLTLRGRLSRSATAAGEVELVFIEREAGRYEAKAAPGPGAWRLRLANRGQAVFEAERGLTWP